MSTLSKYDTLPIMKTAVTIDQVKDFLENLTPEVDLSSVRQLAEGHNAQAFAYKCPEGAYVIRVADTAKNFEQDDYAYKSLSGQLPVPKVIAIGKMQESIFYCVSEFVEGTPSNKLSDEDFQVLLPDVQTILAATFAMDISGTNGFGPIDPLSGNGIYKTIDEYIQSVKLSKDTMYAAAKKVGLNTVTIDKYSKDIGTTAHYVSNERRLLHGDPSFDNVLIDKGKVVAVIDWEQMAYGDWVSDFARLDFWWPGRHGNIHDFGRYFGLDMSNLSERVLFFKAVNALSAIEFAARTENEHLMLWCQQNLAR